MTTTPVRPAAAAEHGWVHEPDPRVLTPATMITVVRTLAAVGIGLAAIAAPSYDAALPLLVASMATYLAGDMLDGVVARRWEHETRFGGVLDICCDRVCALVFYAGVVWHLPQMELPVAVYVLNFAVVDLVLSLAFTAWPLLSPNYFHLVDRTLWRWNWSRPAKAVNSSAFALLLLTYDVWLCIAAAAALLLAKLVSLTRLVGLLRGTVPARPSAAEISGPAPARPSR